MSHPLPKISAFLLAILFAVTVEAQQAASLAGTIADENGAVISAAKVELSSMASGRSFVTASDASGLYEFTAIPLGSYRIIVTRAGFAGLSRGVSWRRIGAYIEDFVLVPGVIESSVTVTAAKGIGRSAVEAPQTITVADASRIEDRRPSSTLAAVERTPNMTPVGTNPALIRPRLRGLTSNRVLVILDGDRLNNVRSDPTSGVSPSVIDVTQLEAVEVLSGAGSSLYGSDAMAGIINLVTPGVVRGDQSHYLGFRFDGDFHGNGIFRRGGVTLNWSERVFALRVGGSLFRESNYRSGNQPISTDEVVQLGNLATSMGNAIGNSVARTYAVWTLPARSKILNSQGHGFNDHVDAWFFPTANQSLRYDQLNSQHQNLGFSFIATPFDPRTQFNSFRRLDKYGVRYEVRELNRWLPRIELRAYRQKYSFPDDTITSPIVPGSSFTFVPDPSAPQNLLAVLTGNRSAFTSGNLSANKTSITTCAFNAQTTLVPSVATLITTGVSYLRDASADEFSRSDFTPPFAVVTGRASNPNVVYANFGWFNLIEYEAIRWLRLTGGLRLDRWRTRARPTSGFPLGVESTLLDVSFGRLIANPGSINTAGAAGIVDLIRGHGDIATNRTVVTGNAGFVIRLKQGINPYFRWGNSYREPGVTERYLLRDFGDPTFSVLVVPNTTLKPERGRSYEAGVKVERARGRAQVGYFRNDVTDFIGSAFAPALFVPADPAHGLHPVSPFFPFHGVLYVQRTNTARARISGLEATYEIGLPLGRAGTITPGGTLAWLKGSNLTPDQNTLKLIGQFYNRSDTPVPLQGSATDVPLSSITPFRMVDGLRYDNSKHDWFAEYEFRYQKRVKRADPLDLAATISTQYGSLASLSSFIIHGVRGGYQHVKEHHRISFSVGVENLMNRFYFEQFQTAPAPGRSVSFGTTIEWLDVLKK
jgi:outer membrane receptor protein involved in Fe transport